MSLKVTYSVNISHCGDGGGAVGFTPDGPTAFYSGSQVVAGLAAPTAAQITTALTAMATDINAQAVLNAAQLARVQAFETGGG
jgi:hypothetical protein